ncbi:MAG: DUF697 domain-containing protein [Zunongwangia sp.]|uniref:YcjF family protein n=1 Tax=Zunongwangia sp. TaxID=1965325 RepID=UPI0032421526
MYNLTEIVKEQLEKAIKDRGEVNILVAGKTGVGKSTLINAVFQGNYADTGQGKPVTQNTRKITKEGIPLSLYDTRGLELKEFKTNLKEIEDIVKELKSDKDPKKHIHAAWICIDENSRRVEDAEIELCEMLSNHLPVIGVITKCISDNNFKAEVQDILRPSKNVVRTNSISRILDDGHIIQPTGLENLVDLTMEIIPEGQQNAFAAAQKVSSKQKLRKAHKIVAAAATFSAGTGASPIPFSDAIALVATQVGMLASITAVFGIELKKSFLFTLVSSTLTGAGATLAGKTVVANLMKFFPGAGTVAGGVISASTAAFLTTAFGEAYIGTLNQLTKDKNINEIGTDEIVREFKSKLKIGEQKPVN